MPSPIQELYETRAYPAMSHPLSDPAVSAVAAMLGGLDVRHPARARILEIGCCSGHNLIPLAMRWPDSRFVGIDLSAPSVQNARELATVAGVNNIGFHAVDLRGFDAGGEPFDYIIAHGFFSWVPDEVKAALFTFCQQHLAPKGIATISFNLECGWLPRFPVIQKTKAIQQAGAVDEMSALAILRSVTEPDSPELPIIDDMLAKGPAILAFDDFGPVNDPWPLDRFVQSAAAAGLRWLGESDPGQNLPQNLDEETLVSLRQEFSDQLSLQIAADAAAGRTFRSIVLCREDAALADFEFDRSFELSVRVGREPLGEKRIFQAIASFAPACIPMMEVAIPGMARGDVARWIRDGIHRGWVRPRIEPVRFETGPPERPVLNAFRLECARRGLPLVDIWHQPCSFPIRHYDVLAAMDGTQDQAELAAFSKRHCPELAFEPWLRHLAGRGMFA